MPPQIVDPWSSPTTYPSSPLFTSPAGASSQAADPTVGERFQSLLNRGRDVMTRAGDRAKTALSSVDTPENRGRMRAASGLGATALGVAPGALQTLSQQGILPAAVSTGAGLLAGTAVSPVANAMMRSGSLPMKLAGFGLQALAPAAAQAGTAGLFGAAEAGKTGSGGADVSIPGTPVTPEIPISDAARERIQRERDLAYETKARTQLGQAQLGLDRQALMDQNNALVQLQKSLLPIQERTMRQQLVNQQALINSQTAAYQQLGRQAGMFKLAGQGMAEAGATMRTALSQNPYAGSTIQAPSISFG